MPPPLTRWRAASVLAAMVSVAAVGRADELEDARSLYARGKAAYDRGEYQEALAQFSRAHALHPTAALLFNMAQASRLSGEGHCAEALALYERYLEQDPAPENPAEVRERITQMRACAKDEPRPPSAKFPATDGAGSVPAGPPRSKPPPTTDAAISKPSPAQTPRPEKAPAPRPTPLAAVLATGIGASLAVAGGILYLTARSKFDDARAVCPCPEGTYSDWQTLTTVSYALMATGVVVSGTGAAFWIFSGGSNAADSKVSGAGLRFSGRF